MDSRFGTMLRGWWLGPLLIVSLGCWQEVHYNPDKPVALTAVANQDAEPSTTEPGEQDPPAADPQHQSIDISAAELFGIAENEATSEQPTPDADPVDVAHAPDSDLPDNEREGNVAQGDFVESEDSGTLDTDPEPAVELPTVAIESQPQAAVEETPPQDTVVEAIPAADTVEVLRPSRTALAVWRMSSRWSFAAAIYAKDQPAERYRDSLDQATYAADLVGVELPEFPVAEGMSRETAVIAYLLDAGTAVFVAKLNDDYVPEYAALAELAIRTNALLLVYTPKSQQLDPLVSSIRQSAERSGLPSDLWEELVSMLERREPFADVKQRVLAFHTQVADYLAGDE